MKHPLGILQLEVKVDSGDFQTTKTYGRKMS